MQVREDCREGRKPRHTGLRLSIAFRRRAQVTAVGVPWGEEYVACWLLGRAGERLQEGRLRVGDESQFELGVLLRSAVVCLIRVCGGD